MLLLRYVTDLHHISKCVSSPGLSRMQGCLLYVVNFHVMAIEHFLHGDFEWFAGPLDSLLWCQYFLQGEYGQFFAIHLDSPNTISSICHFAFNGYVWKGGDWRLHLHLLICMYEGGSNENLKYFHLLVIEHNLHLTCLNFSHNIPWAQWFLYSSYKVHEVLHVNHASVLWSHNLMYLILEWRMFLLSHTFSDFLSICRLDAVRNMQQSVETSFFYRFQ
jgi:hypothetical protein